MLLSAIKANSREKAKLSSYKLKDVYQVWFTKRKDNTSVELGTIGKS